jgi:hypothetical protein
MIHRNFTHQYCQKIFVSGLLLLMLVLGSVNLGYTQSANFVNGGSGTFCSSNGKFYDQGGAASNYGSTGGAYQTYTLYPGITGSKIRISMKYGLGTGSCAPGDGYSTVLQVFNGVGTGGTVLSCMVGSNGTLSQITSTDATGALTFRLYTSSTPSGGYGWDATVSVVNPSAESNVNFTSGGSTTFSGGTFYDQGGAGSNYSSTGGALQLHTLYPSDPGSKLRVNRMSWGLGTGGCAPGDGYSTVLEVFNGVGAGGSRLLCATGNGTLTSSPLTSTDATGALTFRLYTSGTPRGAFGWDASISMLDPIATPTTITVSGTQPSCQLTSASSTDYNSTTTLGTLLWSLTGISNTTGSLSASAINSSNGVVSWPSGWSGSATINVVSTGCSRTSTAATRNVTVNANPTALVLTGSTICASPGSNGTITSSTSVSGVSYQLYNSSNATVQSAKSGTGSGLSWTGLSAGNGYYVRATNASSCTATSSAVNVATTANPTALVLTGSTICASPGSNGTITSSTSVSGVSYQLYNSSNATVQSAKSGTGSGLSWTGLSAGNGYYVIATNAATCTATSSAVNVSTTANPTALVLTGSTICASPGGNGTITSSTSVSGVSYQLYNSSNATVQSAKSGTGSGLSWTGLSAGNGYYVIATNAATCTATSSAVNVSTTANPTALVLTGSTICASPGSNGTITSSTSVSGVSYQLYNSSNATVQSAKSGTGSGLSWTGLSAGNGYYVIATNAATCTATSSAVNIGTNPNPTASAGAALSAICAGGTTVALGGSVGGGATGGTWDDGGAGGTFDPNANDLNATYTAANAPSTVTLTLTTSGGCGTASATKNITVNARPTAAISGTATICNGQSTDLTITLTGAGPFSGTLSNGAAFSGSSPITVSVSPGTNTTYTIATLSDANCTAIGAGLSGSAAITVNSNCGSVWNGSQSSVWNNGNNWTPNTVPNGCGFDVIIPNTVPNYPEIGNATFNVGNVTLDDDAYILLSNAGGGLDVCENITGGSGTGSAFTGVGRVTLKNGSVQHKIGGIVFADIIQLDDNYGAGFVAGGTLNVQGVLELKAGTFATTGGTLRFKSSSVSSAAILDNFSTGYLGTVTGTVQAERFYEAATDTRLHNQHYFGSPVNAPAVTQFAPAKGANGVAVTPTANCDETQTAHNGNYGNVFEWEEDLVSNCYLEGWKVRSAGVVQNARGYSVVKVGSGTLTLTGTPNLDSYYEVAGLTNSSSGLTYSKQGNPYNFGWSLISNPYQASIDLNAVDNADFDDNVLVLNTHGMFPGTFQPVSMAGSGLLAPFQGFIARKSTVGGTATFKVNATDRRRAASTFHKYGDHQMNLMVVGNGFADITYLNFDPNSTDQYDAKHDALKAASNSGQPTLFTYILGSWSSINTNPDVITTPTVRVGFKPGANGTFMFQGEGFDEVPNTTVFLEDLRDNVMQNLTAIPDYTFTSDVNDATDRFLLHFRFEAPNSIGNSEENLSAIKMFPNPTSGMLVLETDAKEDMRVEITDMNGKVVIATEMYRNKTIDVSMLASAIYQVRITSSKGSVVKRLVKE